MSRSLFSFDSAVVRLVYSKIDPALSFFSFYQDWMMFAPNPTRINSEMYAIVEFSSGDIVKYYFDSPNKLNHIDKYLGGEKMRKYFQDTVSNNRNHFTYRDLSKYVLRQVADANIEKIPLRVKLVYSKNFIPSPYEEFRSSSKQNLKYIDEVLYIHEVI